MEHVYKGEVGVVNGKSVKRVKKRDHGERESGGEENREPNKKAGKLLQKEEWVGEEGL